MKFFVAFVLSVFSILCVVKDSQCSKILVVIPTDSYSHQIPYRSLWLALHNRGHEITLATSKQLAELNLPNVTQINITACQNTMKEVDFYQFRFDGMSFLTFMEDYMLEVMDCFTENTLNNPEIRKLYSPESNATFDVVMVEAFYSPAVFGLAHRFNAPLIGLSPLGLSAVLEHALGGSVLPSHEYTWEMEANTGPKLPFWKRLQNFVQLWRNLYHCYQVHFPSQQAIAEKYFGTSSPPVLDILKNMSLIFVNQGDGLAPARSRLANMITFTSLHVLKDPAPLSKDLKSFLDDAKDGFIYMSMGSNLMSSDMPQEIQQLFLDVFSKLPYKVVWKYEKELDNAPENLFYGPWFPQQSILAHPNIKLFISHGGLMSSMETIYFKVPVIGIPILGDQDYQTGRMEAVGVGKRLSLLTLTREGLETAVHEVITNKEYKERLVHLDTIMSEKHYDTVDHLVWWTEHVIRHKGTPHLRTSLAWQPWYQRSDMDIVIFLTIVTFVTVCSIFCLIAALIVYTIRRLRVFSTVKKQKKN